MNPDFPYSYFVFSFLSFHELKVAKVHHLWKSFFSNLVLLPQSPLPGKFSLREWHRFDVSQICWEVEVHGTCLVNRQTWRHHYTNTFSTSKNEWMRVSSSYESLVLFSLSYTLPIHQTPNNLVLVLKRGPEEVTIGATLTWRSKNLLPGNTGIGFSVSPWMLANITYIRGWGMSLLFLQAHC